MGQLNNKMHTVSPGCRTNLSTRTYETIQEAIDQAEPGSVIILNSGDHFGKDKGPIIMKSEMHFVGMHGASICSPLCGDHCDVIFDNVNFRNCDNDSIIFKGRGYLFRNCEFHIRINDCERSKKEAKFGFHLAGGSALLQNPIFCIDIENIDVFIAIGADTLATYLSLESPIIRIKYDKVCKIETYFFRGASKSATVPYFEAFSTSLHLRTEDKCVIYDGHCCKSTCEKRHCGKNECKCKKSHTCCRKKCGITSGLSSSIRLFRGIDCVNSSLMSSKVYFINGHGCFNIAAGDTPVFINGLTVMATNPKKWRINNYRNIYLAAFMSNLVNASEIGEYRYPDDGKTTDCSESCERSCDQPCEQPCNPCGPCGPCGPPVLCATAGLSSPSVIMPPVCNPCGQPTPCQPCGQPYPTPCQPCFPTCGPMPNNCCPPNASKCEGQCNHLAPLCPPAPCPPKPALCIPKCNIDGSCDPPVALPICTPAPCPPLSYYPILPQQACGIRRIPISRAPKQNHYDSDSDDSASYY